MAASSTPPKTLHTLVVKKARDFPRFGWDSLRNHEVNANPILPVLDKCYANEEANRPTVDHLWIIAYTSSSSSSIYDVKFILSCTDGVTGKYPCFIFTPIPYQFITSDNTTYTALRSLVSHLLANQPSERVYSVFAPQIVARTFASIFAEKTGIQPIQEPYYEAKISYLTHQTLLNTDRPLRPDLECNLRPALPTDREGVAELCHAFAAESPPFTLTQEGAYYETDKLIRRGLVWVHTLAQRGGKESIVSIVAFTRNSERVATITKVYSHPNCRGLGCAERLVRRVCHHLFTEKRKHTITLFVGLGNRAANVYRRVGFVGIGDGAAPAPGIDIWTEIGFDRRYVTLGHW